MKIKTNKSKEIILVILRIAIGGHLFFNGLVKLFTPSWSAQSFLDGSYGIFKWLGSISQLVRIIDFLNIWLLLFAGIALILGWFERLAALIGVCLLSMYYLAYIPLDPSAGSTGGFGPTFIVNLLLVEVIALIVLFLMPTGHFIGFARIFKKSEAGDSELTSNSDNKRREFLKSMAGVPFLAIFSIPLLNRNTTGSIDAMSGATALGRTDVFRAEYERLKKLDLSLNEGVAQSRENMPYGHIGNLKMSRLIGGNRIILHEYCARDLRFVSKLARLYNTEDRILMTLKSMESQGIDTMFLSFRNFQDYKLRDYWKEWGGSLQWISELQTSHIEKLPEIIERNLMIGASALCLSREVCDTWVAGGEYDNLPKALEIAKGFDVPVGIGGHYNETFKFAVDEKLRPDFYFKSYHKDTYWSAHPEANRRYMEVYKETTENHGYFHDNLWCRNPNEFSDMMKDTDIPWIAFKTTAGGALPTQEGFEFALRGGADFICCSMYDFEIGDSIRSLKRAYLDI